MERKLIHRAVVHWQATQYHVHYRRRFICDYEHELRSLQSMWAERRGEQSVRNIVGARSGFLSKGRRDRSVSLLFRSHHEPRACTNPPRIHLCLQQLTKLSAYTSKIIRCEGEIEFVKYFQKQTDRSYRCTIPVKKIDDNDVEHDQECGDTISVSKVSYFNLKRHIMRKHDSVLREHGEARAKREHFEYGWNRKYWLIIN